MKKKNNLLVFSLCSGGVLVIRLWKNVIMIGCLGFFDLSFAKACTENAKKFLIKSDAK